MSNCFNPANILLPNDCIDMKKWSVIACDQFTSQADYWDSSVLCAHCRENTQITTQTFSNR